MSNISKLLLEIIQYIPKDQEKLIKKIRNDEFKTFSSFESEYVSLGLDRDILNHFKCRIGSLEDQVCLMQRNEFGVFYFTSPASSKVAGKAEISKIKITPSVPAHLMDHDGAITNTVTHPATDKDMATKSIPNTLGSAHVKPVRNRIKTGIHSSPVEFTQYGPFSSFAPSVDSMCASLDPSDSSECYYPGRIATVESSILSSNLNLVFSKPDSSWTLLNCIDDLPPVTDLAQLNSYPPFKEFNFEEILALSSKMEKARKSSSPTMIQQILEENSALLHLLFEHHKLRLTSSKPSHVSEGEQKVADLLVKNLTCLINWAKPGHLAKGMYLQEFMEWKKEIETAYQGTCNAKSVKTNQVGSKAFK